MVVCFIIFSPLFILAQITENQAVSSRVVKVLKGQKLVVEAFATFDKPEILTEGEGLNTTKKVANIAANTAALLSVQDVNIGTESKSKSLNVNILAAIPLLKNLFSKARNRHNIRVPLLPKQPKAFLEIAVYSDSLQTELLSSRKIEITEKSEIFWEKLQDSLVLDTDGFAVVSLKNNSDIPVLFDNLELRTYGTFKAKIIQENHYEPFGMTLQGLDYVAEDTRGNKFLYNGGVERQEELGLYWDDSHARGYNMQNGRFEQIDPLSEKYTGITGYNFSFNNPTNLNDPSGLDPENFEDWVARNQREFDEFNRQTDAAAGFGNGGTYGTKQKIKPTVYVYAINYENTKTSPDGTSTTSTVSMGYQQLKKIAGYIGDIYRKNGISVNIRIITEVQAEAIRSKLHPTSAMVGVSDEPGKLGGATLMTLNQGKESIKGDEYVNFNSSRVFLDQDGDYAVAYAAAHEVWHQWTQKAALYTDTNPIYTEGGVGTGTMSYRRKDVYFGDFHFSTYPNLNAEGGSHPYPKTPNGIAELVIPQQKELVLKFFKQYGR